LYINIEKLRLKTINHSFEFILGFCSAFDFKNGAPKEKGCTVPLYGKKSKCVIKIVPQEDKGKTFQMDEQCIKYRE
jgi:hypothetical protein